MTTSLGTIPEDFPINGVYEAPLLAALPALIYAMRPNFRELVWDSDSGFADDWRDHSSVSGNITDGYVFRLGRRAFSAASLAIFAGEAVSDTSGGAPSGPAGGDLAGTYPNPTLSSTKTNAILAAAAAADSTLNGVTANLAGAATGKVLGFSGGLIVPVDQTALSPTDWRLALDVDFTQLSAQTIVNGNNVIAGNTWTGVNIASGAALFSIVNGSALEMKTNATYSEMYNTIRSLPHIKIALSDILPAEASLDSEIRVWLAMDVLNPTNNIEVIQAGLCANTFVSGQDLFVRAVNGRIAGTIWRHYDAVANANGTFDNATLQVADADVVSVIHVKDMVAARGRWMYGANTLTPPVSWNTPRSLSLVGGFDLSKTQTTGAILNPRWTSLAGVALYIGVSNSNTLNNTAFKGLMKRIRVEWR